MRVSNVGASHLPREYPFTVSEPFLMRVPPRWSESCAIRSVTEIASQFKREYHESGASQ